MLGAAFTASIATVVVADAAAIAPCLAAAGRRGIQTRPNRKAAAAEPQLHVVKTRGPALTRRYALAVGRNMVRSSPAAAATPQTDSRDQFKSINRPAASASPAITFVICGC